MNTLFKTGLCIFALSAATLSHGSELGRIFYTPEQRVQLESSRALGAGDSRRTISVTGIVQRHGGDRTIWINGVPQQVGKSEDNSPESATIEVPGQSRKIRTKVGQKVSVDPSAPDQ